MKQEHFHCPIFFDSFVHFKYSEEYEFFFSFWKARFSKMNISYVGKHLSPSPSNRLLKASFPFTSPPSILIFYCASYFRFYQSHWIDESRTLRCLPLPTPFSVRPDSCLQSGLGIHHFGCQFGAVFCRLSTTLDQDSKVSPGHVHRFGDSLCLRF